MKRCIAYSNSVHIRRPSMTSRIDAARLAAPQLAYAAKPRNAAHVSANAGGEINVSRSSKSLRNNLIRGGADLFLVISRSQFVPSKQPHAHKVAPPIKLQSHGNHRICENHGELPGRQMLAVRPCQG